MRRSRTPGSSNTSQSSQICVSRTRRSINNYARCPEIVYLVPNSISKDEINALPIRRYEGDVVLVITPEQAQRAAQDFTAERLVGFDTETRPTFKVGQKYPVALAQVATARAVYLFQLQQMDGTSILRELLQSNAVKAGVGIGDDLKALRELFAFEPQALADLGAIA